MTIKITVDEYTYTAVFEPAEEGGFIVTFPALPGVVTEGDTLEEAQAMAADALRGYLESLAKDGIPAPIEDASMKTEWRQRNGDPIERHAHQVARITLALEDAKSGRPGIPHEAVDEWMASWDTDHELPRPTPP
jgi:predicted RNase H-like HicB family nuclease